MWWFGWGKKKAQVRGKDVDDGLPELSGLIERLEKCVEAYEETRRCLWRVEKRLKSRNIDLMENNGDDQDYSWADRVK